MSQGGTCNVNPEFLKANRALAVVVLGIACARCGPHGVTPSVVISSESKPKDEATRRRELLVLLEKAKQAGTWTALLELEEQKSDSSLIQSELEAARPAFVDGVISNFGAQAKSPAVIDIVRRMVEYCASHGPRVEIRFRWRRAQIPALDAWLRKGKDKEYVRRNADSFGEALHPRQYLDGECPLASTRKNSSLVLRKSRDVYVFTVRAEQGFPTEHVILVQAHQDFRVTTLDRDTHEVRVAPRHAYRSRPVTRGFETPRVGRILSEMSEDQIVSSFHDLLDLALRLVERAGTATRERDALDR